MKSPQSGGMAVFIRRYMVPYWLWYLAGVAALVATNALSVQIPIFLKDGIDALSLGAEGTPVIWRSSVSVALMGVMVIVVRTLSRILFFTPGRLVEARLKRDLFARILVQQPAFLRQWPTGDLISRVQSDVSMLRLLAGFASLQVFNTVTAVGLVSLQMMRLSPDLTVWLILPVVAALLFIQLFLRRLFEIMRRMQLQAAALADHALSSYQGVASVKGFVAEDAFSAQFESLNQAYLRSTLQRAHIRTFLSPTLTLAASVNVAIVLFIGGARALPEVGTLSIGELVAFVTLIAYLTAPLRSLSFLLSLVKQAQAGLERIDAVMVPSPDRPDLPDPVRPASTAPALEIRDLSFAYPDDPETLAIQGISASVPAGGTLGILGLTGSGKTTVLRLLARLYNPPRGTIFIDGVDILTLDLDAWRETASLVPQRAFLFSETLRENILLDRVDPERLAGLLDLSALTPDVASLPDGIETEVGESGVMLSGGQRQRVALARGLARTNTLLMLDDVLSAVDHHTEQALLQSLRATGEDRAVTTVIVAHRISALRHADQILVLDSGSLTARGTHEELCNTPGLYQEIWLKQTEEEPENG